MPEPVPEPGQVVLEVLRCGICGSDLHARHHCDEYAAILTEVGYDDYMRSDQSVVFGHEFSGAVGEYGTGCRQELPAGTHVVALPLMRRKGTPHATGLSAAAPGAYADRVLVQEALMMPVPNGLLPEMSALTEPLAIRWHAVRRSEIGKREVAIVIGCGPIGLAVVCSLKARGVKMIVASDFLPGRRALATACGADILVDPARDSPYTAADRGHLTTIPEVVELAMSTVEKLRRLPIAWQHVWRGIDALGIKPKHPVVFECVGVPGVLDAIIAATPLFSRVIVIGVCIGDDTIRPSIAINKEIDLRFVLGYTPLEFRDTLHALAEGKLDAAALVTGQVGLDGVASAFDALGNPEVHAKILIDPRSSATEPVRV
ncbi:MAG: zinc-binding dehydrogenase [Actinomycetota bacterium]|nr:zinc-binding dehydrogenase [Actinomycetota bacterium]